MKIGLEIRPEIEQALNEFKSILNFLNHKEQDLVISKSLNRKDYPAYIKPIASNQFVEQIDVLLSIGGDGTFLGGMRKVKGTDVPIMGIHLGGLGFLAELTEENYKKKINLFLNDDFTIEERYGFDAELDGEKHPDSLWAINEFHIDKGHTTSMISISTYVGEEYLNTYRGDGLLISTPTGSTAYGLSAGGPIITPDLDIVSIQPICPHNLSIRPVIVSGEKEIRIDCNGFNDDESLIVDGHRRFSLNESDCICIKKSPKTVKLVRFKTESFFKTLRKKLHWGLDVRETKQ